MNRYCGWIIDWLGIEGIQPAMSEEPSPLGWHPAWPSWFDVLSAPKTNQGELEKPGNSGSRDKGWNQELIAVPGTVGQLPERHNLVFRHGHVPEC